MVKIDFECPICNETNNLVLMGNEYGEFDKYCKACEAPLEVSNKTNKIEVKAQFPKEIVKNTIRENKIPSDYKKYEMDNSHHKIVKIIAILILTSSLMGLTTGWKLVSFFEADYTESGKINLEIVVRNSTTDLENVAIIFNNVNMNYTYTENGTYNILVAPGKYFAEIIAPEHKNATMEFFVIPQDSNLRLPDTSKGIEGTNRFTFLMKEGKGNISLEENVYVKISSWCPNLIFLFSLIGLWGAWVTYTLQSYNNAQIGAFFSVLAMGFLIIGPILGIIALFYLKKYKFLFTASFKN